MITRHYGYLSNDNRASGGEHFECDILTCSHCQAVIERIKWEVKGGWCPRCDAHVCHPCAKVMQTEGCLPFRKLVDQHLEAQERRRQLSRAMGLDEGGK